MGCRTGSVVFGPVGGFCLSPQSVFGLQLLHASLLGLFTFIDVNKHAQPFVYAALRIVDRYAQMAPLYDWLNKLTA